jgi:phosphoglycolate phosphatase
MIKRRRSALTARAVLFDLDGTIADTRDDIAFSLNYALARLKRAPRTLDEVTRFIGDGVNELLRRALGPVDDAAHREAVALFKEHYEKHCFDRTRLFPGVLDIFRHYSGKALGVVTNKPEAPTWEILRVLGAADFIKVAVGGDRVKALKPAPDSLLEAARRLGVTPGEAVIVGDSPMDVEAGRRAGMGAIAVTYGYRPRAELEAAKPDFLIDRLDELREVLI